MFQSIAFSRGENLKAEDSPNCQWGVWRAPVQCLNPLTTRSNDTKKWCFLWYPCDHRSVQNLRNQMHTSCGFVPIFKHFLYINKYRQLILISQQSSTHLTLRCIIRLFCALVSMVSLTKHWTTFWDFSFPHRFTKRMGPAWVVSLQEVFVVDLKSLNAVYILFTWPLFISNWNCVAIFWDEFEKMLCFWQGIVVEGRSRMRYGRCRLS